MKPTASIIQFQKKQESEFICSACGADRGCDCNAPALKRLDELEERAERERRQKREQKRREREKNKQKQHSVGTTEKQYTLEHYQSALIIHAEQAIDLASMFSASLEIMPAAITNDAISSANRAAEAWIKLTDQLRRK